LSDKYNKEWDFKVVSLKKKQQLYKLKLGYDWKLHCVILPFSL